MALKASGFGGTSKLHDLTAGGGVLCDLCGDEVDSEVADAVALDCSYAQCDPESSCYHTHCLEKFLKSMKCERNRKIGFPCPRGCGKGTKFKEACRGKILKSHPVTIRSEANKKRRQAELEQLAQAAAQRKKDEATKAAAAKTAASKAKEKEKGKAAAKPAAIKALNVANTAITNSAPPKTAAQLQKEALAAAAKNLKSQILARSASSSSAASLAAGGGRLASAASSGRASAAGSASGKKEVKTLDEYLAERSSSAMERSSSVASSSAPQASAWGKSRASSASSLEASEMADAAAALAAAPAAPAPAPQLSAEDAFPPPAVAGRPPRPPPPAAPAPAPAPAPVPAAAAAPPQGVWAQKPAVAVVTQPPPPPPRPAAPAAPTPAPVAAAASKGKAAVVAVAATMAADDSKLSRTQRKNQKRAEKKAAAAAAAAAEREVVTSPGASNPSPADSLPTSPMGGAGLAPTAPAQAAAVAAAPGPAPAAAPAAEAASTAGEVALDEGFERCMQALVQHKLQHQVEQLAALGFAPSAALAAVQQHGGSLEGALVTLLEQATGVQDSMHGLGLAACAASAEVDLTDELAHMQDLQARYSLTPAAVQMLVVEHQGDLDALAASLAQQHQAMLAFDNSGGAAQQQPQQAQQQALQQAQQQALQQAQQQQETRHVALQSDPFGAGAGLFGTLGGSARSPFSLDSWGGAATASVDTASSGAGCYSAFGFGGLAEAALHAVHGGGQAELLGGVGTPTSQDHTSAAAAFGAGIWSTSTTAAQSPHGSLASAGGALGYGSNSHLQSLLGAPDASSSAAAASAAAFGALGGFGGLPAASGAFDQHPLASSSGSLMPFPGGGLQQAAGQLGGWRSGEGVHQVVQQPAFAGLPAAASLWGGGSTSGLGAGLPDSGEQLVR